MCLDELRIFQQVENTVRLQTVREREGKDQNIPDYFQIIYLKLITLFTIQDYLQNTFDKINILNFI